MILLFGLTQLAAAADEAKSPKETYDEPSILYEANMFFGEATEGLGKVVEKVFKEHGRPVGYIKGEEVSGAIAVGLNYGSGELVLKNGERAKVFWQGPSVGYDLGFHASKVFTLVYELPSAEAIYQRFPGVDGSLYYVAGVGVNYQYRDGVVLAPIRLGAGWRAGASVGYLNYSKERRYLPF
jgi:hypothetical protein